MTDQEERIKELEKKLENMERSGPRPVLGYEYKSERRILGMPLIHIVLGYGNDVKNPSIVARGFIAIGSVAVGVFALGGLSFGLFCFGGVALGALALGGIAGGGVAIGGMAIAYFAFGGMAIGHFAMGGLAIGQYAVGATAVGEHVISKKAWDPMVIQYVRHQFGWLGQWITGLLHHP